MAKRGNKGMRNLRSTGLTIANSTARITEKAAVGLFRWATTNHLGKGMAFKNIPQMGFADPVQYILIELFCGLLGVALTSVFAYLLIAYGIPLFLLLMFAG